jgi:hypothetical protein
LNYKKLVLFHFLFECSRVKKPDYCFRFFSLSALNFFRFACFYVKQKYIVFILLQIFLFFASNVFSSSSLQNFSFPFYFTLTFEFCFVPGAVVVYDVLVVFDAAVDCRPSVFNVLKSLDPLYFVQPIFER